MRRSSRFLPRRGRARVCECVRAYISKPVVTAPPRHYLSHASAPIFIGEVIHEASSSSPPLLLLPYLPWAHKQRALSRELRGGGGKVVPFAFPDQNCPSILSRNPSPPFLFLLIEKKFVSDARAKDCENRV